MIRRLPIGGRTILFIASGFAMNFDPVNHADKTNITVLGNAGHPPSKEKSNDDESSVFQNGQPVAAQAGEVPVVNPGDSPVIPDLTLPHVDFQNLEDVDLSSLQTWGTQTGIVGRTMNLIFPKGTNMKHVNLVTLIKTKPMAGVAVRQFFDTFVPKDEAGKKEFSAWRKAFVDATDKARGGDGTAKEVGADPGDKKSALEGGAGEKTEALSLPHVDLSHVHDVDLSEIADSWRGPGGETMDDLPKNVDMKHVDFVALMRKDPTTLDYLKKLIKGVVPADQHTRLEKKQWQRAFDKAVCLGRTNGENFCPVVSKQLYEAFTHKFKIQIRYRHIVFTRCTGYVM